MSLDKAIKYGKEKRKQYRGAKAVDCTCRNHGSRDWGLSNRLHKFKKKEPLEETFENLSNSISLKIDNMLDASSSNKWN